MQSLQLPKSSSQYEHKNDQHYLVQVNQQTKCICQLCSCGKHRCPRPKIKGQFETSYNSHYKNTHIIVPASIPNYSYPDRHYNLDSLKTNYKQSYNEQPLVQYHQKLNSSRLENIGKSLVRPNIPSVPFYGNSSYTDQYKPYVLKSNSNPEDEDMYINRRQKIPDYGFQSRAKFEDSTSYNQHYKAPQVQIQRYPPPVYNKPSIPFNGSSSYKDQYKQYNIQPQYQQYSKSMVVGPKVKFEGNTTYNDLYKDFTIAPEEKVSGKPCPLQGAFIPSSNYLSNSRHIHYDQKTKTFT